ncbi:MAG: tRNA (N6-threonylcarbamoyladenosine(37)-N6)-methyltransferase TrmO [Desulfocapsaceae bacterium]|jgi:tRNA-Thr(GGU) m(6)t(6)A37 methyltransferase TsaA|nr:tRNA (N6-threonylcarbamoyladenosine(37)-N6)-methyltransferase TrmO [Desulfocapsaceae bacterium]
MEAIGVIRSPFEVLANMPVQPRGAANIKGEVIVDPAYQEGLADLDGFSHIYILYHFHQARRTELKVIPFMDDTLRGVFSTRSPLRPNHIGLSLVELLEVRENRLVVCGIDVLDNTPLLDIKPYIAVFDRVAESRSGWLSADEHEVAKKRSDSRFS